MLESHKMTKICFPENVPLFKIAIHLRLGNLLWEATCVVSVSSHKVVAQWLELQAVNWEKLALNPVLPFQTLGKFVGSTLL